MTNLHTLPQRQKSTPELRAEMTRLALGPRDAGRDSRLEEIERLLEERRWERKAA